MPRSGPEYGDDLRQGVDYFEVLGVDETASAEDVVAAFRAKIRAVHPDLNGGKHDPEAVGRIARARKTLTGADREAYLKVRAAKRDAAQPTSAPAPGAAPGATGDVWDGPEARAWRWAAEEVRRRAEAEAQAWARTKEEVRRKAEAEAQAWARAKENVRRQADEEAQAWSRMKERIQREADAGARSRRAANPSATESPRAISSPRPASPASRSAAASRAPRPFDRGPVIPPSGAGRRAPMPAPSHQSPDEIHRDAQRRSAEILDEARWRSGDTLAEVQRRSRETLAAARRRSEETPRRSRL